MKILIIGGGIAGCTCAALLEKYHTADITLVEKAPEFRNIGYLISLWSTGRKVLQELGVDGRIVEQGGYEYKTDTILDRHGRLIKKVLLASFRSLGPMVVIERSGLHRGLFELLKKTEVRFNTYATRITQEESGATVEFNDGNIEHFDLVIGADGVHSSTREHVFGLNFLRYYGWSIWMWWTPNTATQPKDAVAYYGSGKVFALLPFNEQSMTVAVATVTPGTGLPVEERKTKLRTLFSGFGTEPCANIDAAPSGTDLYYSDVAEITMPRWHKGRVVLIGDAQHAVSPVTGMGAAMAMEDASVLVEELRSRKNIDEALVYFAKRREKRIRRFRQIVTVMDGWTMAGGLWGALRNLILPWVPESYFVKDLEKFVNTAV